MLWCKPLFDKACYGVNLGYGDSPCYDKKSDEGSNSVRMRPENSGALKVVEN